MNYRIIPILLVCLFSLSIAAVGTQAYAQSKAKKAKKKKKAKKDNQEGKGEQLAQQYHGQALELYKNDDYDGALSYFLKAYGISSDPSTLFNIARCYDHLFQYDQAHTFYKKYLKTGDPLRKDDAKEALAKIEGMPVILKVITIPEGATIYVDGKEVLLQKTPVIGEVSAGKHKVIVELKYHKTVKKKVNIPYGGQARLDITLVKLGEEEEEDIEIEVEEEIEDDVEDIYGEKEEDEEEEDVVEPLEEPKPSGHKIPISLNLALGVTVSTSKTMGSYIDASIGVFYRIKQGFVGLGLDNMFFTDGYVLVVYPAGGYTLKVWKDLSISFAGGFGAVYLRAKDGYDTDGNIIVASGNHWDLAAHASVKLSYKLGPILLRPYRSIATS